MSENTLVLATTNLGKIAEFEFALQDLPWKILPQDHFSIPPYEETGLTFIENAIGKARHVAQYTQLPTLADDSGLVIPALNGEPGIYSARYAGENNNMSANRAKVLNALTHKSHPERTAYFHCCLVFMEQANDPTPLIAEADWHGVIAFEIKGNQGFGYDPLFYLPDHQCTAAELSLEEKNKISHRAQALKKLKKMLFTKIACQR